MNFHEISANELKIKPFNLFEKDWALLCSGSSENFNFMTVSWGCLGIIWQKPVSFVFVRPQRYTFEFLENNNYYSLCFLEEGHRKALNICGTQSGRDIDKVKESKLTPIFDSEAPYFSQSKLVFICRKLHGQFIDPSCFVDKNINLEYPNNDYHKIFIGEVVKCLEKNP